ncbi:unnamed protein product [Moneuplotes crassus]|uniref:Uncharacterized protein n=1 Tax=Euplotes crassus TaxID=5936 RepID=A0AAD1UHW5_EUPCR|nr:unnamed protein product [Moneuplotes crassus]
MEYANNRLKELSFNSNYELKNKILGPTSAGNFADKENNDVFNQLWSCTREDMYPRETQEETNRTYDNYPKDSLSFSEQKFPQNQPKMSNNFDTQNSVQSTAPFFGNDDNSGRDTLLFKCREAIESLQEEIEDYQKALGERDFLLSQAQEREDQLLLSKSNANKEVESLTRKLQESREELANYKSKAAENEEKYDQECHKLLEENKKLRCENIELESSISKYKIKLECIEETVNDLKLKKTSLEDSHERLEVKVKDLKTTINEYETANQQLDTKLIWAEKTYEEGMSKIMTEYEKERELLQKKNEDLIKKAQNSQYDREAKIKAKMKEKIVGIQKGIEASNAEINKLREEKQKLLKKNMKLVQIIDEFKISQRSDSGLYSKVFK